MSLAEGIIIGCIQLVIVLAGVLAYFIFRLRQHKKVILELTEQLELSVSNSSAEKTDDSVNDYIAKNAELKKQLALNEQRVHNLERFRSLYFKVKSNISSIHELENEINEKIDAADFPEEVTKSIEQVFKKLADEKLLLQDHIKQIENQLDILFNSNKPTDDADDENTSSIIQQQKVEISNLTQKIVEMDMETYKVTELNSVIEKLEQRTVELERASTNLQEENDFLCIQIQELLKQEVDKDSNLETTVEELKVKLIQSESKYDDLAHKHTELETEYLKLVESNKPA